jgi:hypothetical protein
LVDFDHHVYRRRPRSLRRGGIATLFGVISLSRIRYERCDTGVGLTCIFPRERLGIVVGKATTALAGRVGMWTAQYTQETVLALLREEHRVTWSVATLRTVVADFSAALAPLTHQAQNTFGSDVRPSRIMLAIRPAGLATWTSSPAESQSTVVVTLVD